MNARALSAYVDGVGLLGPGFASWDEGAPVLSGTRALVLQATVLPPPEGLPPAERRRTGSIVRLALAAGHDALRQARVPGAQLPAIFTSSGADGPNCHEICAELTAERQLSPPAFTTRSTTPPPATGASPPDRPRPRMRCARTMRASPQASSRR